MLLMLCIISLLQREVDDICDEMQVAEFRICKPEDLSVKCAV